MAEACRRLLDGPSPLSEQLRRHGVTPREAQVLSLLGQGVTSTRELAERLVISPRTVEKHVESLCRKLDVRSRSGLAAHAGQLRATT